MDKVKLKRKESRELVLQSLGGAINEDPEPLSARLDVSAMRRTTSERLSATPDSGERDGDSGKKDKQRSESRRKKHDSPNLDKDDEHNDERSNINETAPHKEATSDDQAEILSRSPKDETPPSKVSDDSIANKDSSGSMSQSSPVLSRNRIKVATINIHLADKKEKSPRSPRKSPRHVSDDPELKEIKEKELKMLREHSTVETPVIPIDPLPTESTSSVAADEDPNHLTVPAQDSGPQSGPKSAAAQRLMNKRVGHRRVKSFDVDKLPYAAGIDPETLSPRTDNALQLKLELAQKRLVRQHELSLIILLFTRVIGRRLEVFTRNGDVNGPALQQQSISRGVYHPPMSNAMARIWYWQR